MLAEILSSVLDDFLYEDSVSIKCKDGYNLNKQNSKVDANCTVSYFRY